MGNSSSGAHPRLPETDERSRKEAGGAAATSLGASGASGTSSFEKTVLLHNWWLIKVKDEHSRARLAVGGLVTTGKAARIFTSAPITKRYDGYTLETADGMTVRIQGLINASRTHHNGFPSEACNHFRIGFPYSWKDYADRYFRTDIEGNNSLDPSVESAKNPSYDSPICLKEFPVGRIVDCLNSICKEIVDSAQRGTGTEDNLSENNHDNGNMKGIVTQANQNIDVNSNAAEENASITTLPENDYLGMSSLLDGSEKTNNNVSDDSLLCRNLNIISPLGKVAGLQMESLAVVVKNPDIEKQRIEPISTDTDGVMTAMNGNMCCENVLPTADFGANFFDKLLQESGEASKSVSPREHSIKEAEQLVCLSENTFLSHEPDVEVTDGIQSHMAFVNPPSSDAVCTTKRTGNSLKKGYAKSSSFSALQNSAGKKHNQGVSGAISHLDGANISFKRIRREPLCTERSEIHLELSGAVKNHSRTAVKNVQLREGHYSYDEIVGSGASTTVALKETSEKQLDIVDKGMHGEISLNYYMKDVRGKLSCYLRSAAKKPPSLSVFENVVNQPRESKELSCICLNTTDLGSERVLVECSYNETNDLHSGSSVMMLGSSSGSVKGSSNICNNAEETITDSRNVGMTMSKPPNRWSSLRRSERLLKLKNSTEDKQIFLEHNKRSNNKDGSNSISCGTLNGKGNTPNTEEGTSTTESHPHSGEMHAVVARKLNFSSHISLGDCDTTPIEGTLHIGLDKNNVSSKKQDVEAIHENLPKSRTRHGCQSHENSKGSRKENWSIADTGKNWGHLLSDNHDYMNSENVVKDLYDLTENRIEADSQNHDTATMEQSISDTANGVTGHFKEVHVSEVPLDRQQNDHKSSGKAARKSRQKPSFAPQMMKTPLTRRRTKELSVVSPELLNFRRSRSGWRCYWNFNRHRHYELFS